MSEKFTKKQRALLDQCAFDYENSGGGIKVLCFLGSHSHSMATARSLEKRGYLYISNPGCGEAWASFSDESYSEYVQLFKKSEDEEE